MPADLTKRFDWEGLFDLWFVARTQATDGMTLKAFCEQQQITYTQASTHFSAIERERLERRIKSKMGKVLERSVDIVSESLEESNETDFQRKVDISLKSIPMMADRLGLAPVTTVIENNVTTNIGIALFPPQDEANLKTMLGVEEVIDTSEASTQTEEK